MEDLRLLFLLIFISIFSNLKSQNDKNSFTFSISMINNINIFRSDNSNADFQYPAQLTIGVSLQPEFHFKIKNQQLGLGIKYSFLKRKYAFRHNYTTTNGSRSKYTAFEATSSNDFGGLVKYYIHLKKSKISFQTGVGISFNIFNTHGVNFSGQSVGDTITGEQNITTNFDKKSIHPFFDIGFSYYSPFFAKGIISFHSNIIYQYLFGSFLPNNVTYNAKFSTNNIDKYFNHSFNGSLNNIKIEMGLIFLLSKKKKLEKEKNNYTIY